VTWGGGGSLRALRFALHGRLHRRRGANRRALRDPPPPPRLHVGSLVGGEIAIADRVIRRRS
jgi:hypothetical protein